ncbi:hypothetical protein [Pseudarthrobacter sp. NPDC058119]|uniref:hypothetical protein n=1 Tax=Pseudarthrobacter sp. NPDC058119 TaxID=3346348 RepID=UPI0036DB9126
MSPQSSPRAHNRGRTQVIALTTFLALVMSGCAAAGAEKPPSEGPSASPSASPQATAGAAADGPSSAATMVCGDETKTNIVKALSLPSEPPTTDSWADKLYTCTYALPSGHLLLSVKETSDPAAARTFFDGLQQQAAGAAPIEGLANLGFPAFQTPSSAVFTKDSFVLTVDAAALPARLGPHDVSRDAFAYQIATAVLACWSE